MFCKKRCSATLLKKRLWHRYFPVNFVKFLRTPFLQNTSGRLLLNLQPIARFSFYKQDFSFYKQRQAEIGKKIKQMLSNTLRLNFCHLKIIHILHDVSSKNNRIYSKNKKNNKCVCIHGIKRLTIMKMKMKMKNRPYRYDIN